VINTNALARTSALSGLSRPCKVDQNASHDLSGHSKEVRAILPLNFCAIQKAKICLIDESGWLKSLAGPLTPHIASRNAAKFTIYNRRELIERGYLASGPCLKQDC
jgi:hypothetical protein